MAVSSLGEPRMLSPHTEIEWAGFLAPAYRLQSHGWEFAVQRDYFQDAIMVLMHHGKTRTAARGRVRLSLLMQESRGWIQRLTTLDLPVIHMEEMKFDERLMVYESLGSGRRVERWQRVDMQPELTNEVALVSAAVLGIFRPWTSEIIVPQSKTIDDLLAEIKGLQQPELAAIRERDRRREWSADQAQSRVAQIVQVAA